MQKRNWLIYIGIIGMIVWTSPAPGAEPTVPTPGMVTLVDLGANRCIPCKLMEPIIEQLQKEYDKRVSVLFVDVEKYPELARRLGVRAIPTQVFFGKDGTQASRHEGFMDKKSIVAVFEKLGVPK